jgi:hypothetical protein
MTDYDDTQESLGVSGQVLEALEEAFGVDDGIGRVGYGHDGCANS